MNPQRPAGDMRCPEEFAVLFGEFNTAARDFNLGRLVANNNCFERTVRSIDSVETESLVGNDVNLREREGKTKTVSPLPVIVKSESIPVRASSYRTQQIIFDFCLNGCTFTAVAVNHKRQIINITDNLARVNSDQPLPDIHLVGSQNAADIL